MNKSERTPKPIDEKNRDSSLSPEILARFQASMEEGEDAMIEAGKILRREREAKAREAQKKTTTSRKEKNRDSSLSPEISARFEASMEVNEDLLIEGGRRALERLKKARAEKEKKG